MHKKINIGQKEKKERKIIQKWKYKDFLLESKNHIGIVNQLFLEQSFNGDNTTKNELHKKINSYKQQDIKKDKNLDGLISYEELLEKLVISKLRCYYCRKDVLLLYENNREQKQWTLDRLDNSLGHTKDNVVVCCLKCNLERRCLNDEKFLFTKQMRIIKKN
jgi:hypothetical protein|tara:strand:- start:2901 stop:3386 length:486 start_codon:yes stop_codon:yes gene_type:complete